ncbi:hypothetical protein ACWGCP_03535 [Streptomyces niveus]
MVLSVDEKSQIQALDGSQPVLPMMPGMPERAPTTIRNGLTTLFAAFDVATGEIITSLHRRHRAPEFKKFLIKIEKEVPGHLQVHLICDNYSQAQGRNPAHRSDVLPRPYTALPRTSWGRTVTTGNTENKTAVWLGIVGGTLAILGFFGITSIDELQNAVDPKVIPCERAADALRANDKSPLGPTDSTQVLVEDLRKAADASKDTTLRLLLDSYADIRERPYTHPTERKEVTDKLWSTCWP